MAALNSGMREDITDRKLQNSPGLSVIWRSLCNKYEIFREYHALDDDIERRYDPGKTNYVFIDEVPLCEKFELAVNSLHVSRK